MIVSDVTLTPVCIPLRYRPGIKTTQKTNPVSGFRFALFGLGGHAMFTGLFGLSVGLALQRMCYRAVAFAC
jgi:hypothetical protein